MFLASAAAAANVADHSSRSQVAGIDVVTYRTDVKDVVVILGSLPAGDAMAESGNIAVPTLTGMMLDIGHVADGFPCPFKTIAGGTVRMVQGAGAHDQPREQIGQRIAAGEIDIIHVGLQRRQRHRMRRDR